MAKVKRVCAWCGKLLGYKSGFPKGSPPTHGICPECRQKLREESQKENSNRNKLGEKGGWK